MHAWQNAGVGEDGHFIADGGSSSEEGVRADLAVASDAHIVSDRDMGDEECAFAEADVAGNEAEGTDHAALAEFGESSDFGGGFDEQGEAAVPCADGLCESSALGGVADGTDEFVSFFRHV
jgi:hypothetical protein